MADTTNPVPAAPRQVAAPASLESTAWKWMRYSALLLIPLVWIHLLLQDVIVGVHNIDVNYVMIRWGSVAWQIYDIALLAFAFAHGMNGLRQVLNDFVHTPRARQVLGWVLLAGWVVISVIGAIAIIGGARPLPTN
jgi:succinate dehydrogenase / fumarate reductase, membrane anchor subunit